MGGPYELGTVFRLDAANAYARTTLHNFDGPDGAHPVAAVIAGASGNLYGTTSDGGSAGHGTVFELDAANGYALKTLHSFDGSDGRRPVTPRSSPTPRATSTERPPAATPTTTAPSSSSTPRTTAR